MKTCKLYKTTVPYEFYAKKLGISPIVARIMANRGLTTEDMMREFISDEEEGLYSPWLLKNMKEAVYLLERKIACQKRIRIIGDYDVDGVCSTAILFTGLIAAGAEVDWRIPHRIRDGYGINIQMVKQAIDDGIDTILTCDNGISAANEIELAKNEGLTVIVTDHHEIPEAGIPKADAVINPKQADCQYPYKGICGGEVAFKLMIALYESLQLPHEDLVKMLEYATLATIGDVMLLQDENRRLVKLGLRALHNTQICGIRKLCELFNLPVDKIDVYHVGFMIGPALNAGGRIKTAELAVQLLLETEEDEACKLATELKNLNDMRKSMTEAGLLKAIETVEQSAIKDDRVLVVYISECHESLAGIIAGRLRERYYKPALVFTDAQDGGLKGSGRSIEGYSLYEELCKVSDLMTRFGGHPMAAGVSLPKENLEEFRRSINAYCTLTDEQLTEKVWIDMSLPISQLQYKWIEELSLLEPFGNGNEKPLFMDRYLNVKRAYLLGKEKKMIKLFLKSKEQVNCEALYFGDAEAFFEDIKTTYGEQTLNQMLMGAVNQVNMAVIYYPQINSFRGENTIQIVIKSYALEKEKS